MLQQSEQVYYSSRKQEGVADSAPFPHEEAKASLDELMLCIVRKAAKQWSLIRFRKSEGVYLNQLLQEAYAGGGANLVDWLGVQYS